MENETVRYSNADLEEFKALIESRLARVASQISQLQEQLEDLYENNANGYDMDDNSSLDQEKDILQTMLTRQQKHGNDLENALIRIRNKSYGICEITRKLIDKRRLLAVPTTTKSLAAKQQLQGSSDPSGRQRPTPKKPRINKAVIEAVNNKEKKSTQSSISDDFDDLDFKEDGVDGDFDDQDPALDFDDMTNHEIADDLD